MTARTWTACLSIAAVAALLLPTTSAMKEPDTVVVQHILISFGDKIPGKEIARTKKDAKELAYGLFDRAEAGEEFGALVKEYTNDSYPGIYKMTNRGKVLPDTIQRHEMVKSFGDVSFRLEVGEIGMARYNPELSPYGWHIIKRLE